LQQIAVKKKKLSYESLHKIKPSKNKIFYEKNLN